MKKVPINRVQRLVEEFDGQAGLVVLFDFKSGNIQFAGTSYGETKSLCRDMQSVLDQIAGDLTTGQLQP